MYKREATEGKNEKWFVIVCGLSNKVLLFQFIKEMVFVYTQFRNTNSLLRPSHREITSIGSTQTI